MMKRLMIIAMVSCLPFALPSLATEQDVVPEPKPVEEATAEATKAPAPPPVEAAKPVFVSLPSCFVVHGTSCAPPNSTRLCLLAPFEPELCVCQSNNTWRCLWF